MKQKRILIVRPDRIGDVVLSTPIPREIKKTFPGSYVALYLRNYTKDIYLNNPFVDEIITNDFENKSFANFIKKAKELRKYKFTHALMLLPTEYMNYLLFFAGIPERIGVGHKLYQFLTFTKYVDRKKYIPLRHEADYCMDLARKIGVNTEDLSTEIYLTNSEKEKIKSIRDELLNGKKYLIGIHSTSGNSAPNWKAENYAKLINKLLVYKTEDGEGSGEWERSGEGENISIVVTDNNVPKELQNIAGVVYPNENKNLRESILNFAALDYLVSASTGPMHIAAALKVKTISMFCPLTACSPKLWGPMGNESEIILPSENYCQTKCPGDPKKCTFEGEGGISAELIKNVILKTIANK